jgi:hypothetical protein
VTYKGLAAGTHVFSVAARDSSGNASSATSYTWLIDLSAPAVTIASPASGGFYNAAGWSAACSAGVGVCGTASDPSNVASASVSIKQNATGKYWSGTAFTSKTEMYNPATLSPPGATTSSWFYALSLPSPDGQYTLHVIATDGVGNSISKSSPVSSVFTIKTSPPPAPVITSAPPNPSTSTTAQFSFSDTATAVSFKCQLDGGGFSSCSSPVSYANLSDSSHTFSVHAVDQAGNVSTDTSYSWQIVQSGGMPFQISGNAPGLLYPGAAPQTIPVTLTNPNSVPIDVTSVTVSLTSPSGVCDASTNFQLIQSSVSSTQPVVVGANASVTLTGAQAPSIQMLDTSANQDGCESVKLTLSYTGSAHS